MPQIAIVDPEKCKPDKCGEACAKACPVNRQGEDCIVIDHDQDIAKIDEELCIGCGICPKKCPFDAIDIINLKEEQGDLIHQYDENSFRLYNLPVPKKGKVVGLLGKNGIGKSTALEILAGLLKPNLGNWEEEEMDWEEIIKSFRGTELQNFLGKLKHDEITANYKPQRVNKIKDRYSGKASDLLEGKIEGLEIDRIWDKRIEEMSGGELQLLTIASSIEKNSDVIFFDEPSSYLDVEQRLKVARKIREVAQERNVVLIEHDLAILDFLSDEIHVIFGEPNGYGVVSKSMTEKSGINQYLEGFLDQENVRIRKDSISFPEKKEKTEKRKTLIELPKLEKKLGDFKLTTEAGDLKKGEILGILGRNALGKTTFAKLISGELEPDKGEVKDHSISYKPQYIFPDFSGTVRELYDNAEGVKMEAYSKGFKTNIIEPFKLEDLLEEKVDNLSPGELQRVAIGLCLARDAEIYLFDEPTAFLDVENRLEFAKNIKRYMEREEKTAMVIDHDLLLLDFLADRAMLFEGEPGKSGVGRTPKKLRNGINQFLKNIEITFRRDPNTGRPRANKQGSQKDKEQKEEGDYYCPS